MWYIFFINKKIKIYKLWTNRLSGVLEYGGREGVQGPLGRKVSFLVHSSGYEPGTLAVWKHALVSTAHGLLYKFFQASVWATSINEKRCNKYRAFPIPGDCWQGQGSGYLSASVGGTGDHGKVCWFSASKHSCLALKTILFPWLVKLRT